MRYYCTYFDSNYLMKGLAMLDSLQKYGGEHQVYVICLDNQALQIMEALALPHVQVLPLALIERKYPELRTAKKNRGAVEYYWTLTPVILEYLLQAVPAGDILVYLDSDLYFFSDLDPVFQEMAGASVYIHAHNFPSDWQHLDVYGKYNVGMMAFRNDAEAHVVLEWWKRRCLEYTGREIIQTEDGLSRFGDQKYLDYFQDISQSVRVAAHIGVGVAPWNVHGFALSTKQDGTPLVNGVPVIFYHNHSFAILAEGCVSPAMPAYPLPDEALRLFMAPYIVALERALERARSVVPSFTAGFLQDAAARGGCILVRKTKRDLVGAVADQLVPLGGAWGDNFLLLPAARGAAAPADISPELIKRLQVYEKNPHVARLLNCGCGKHWHPEWLNVDISSPNPEVMCVDLRVDWPLPDNFFDMAYHSHMLEHMSFAEGRKLMHHCWNTLKPGGLMRVAVPDLEGIAREYLAQLAAARRGEEGAEHRLRWMVLELVDQLARHQSGGEMLSYLGQNPVPELAFVLQRIGAEGRGLVNYLHQNPPPPSHAVTDPLLVGQFRMGGEVHRWMYDAFSLADMLRQCGFEDVHVVRADESSWHGFDSFHLDTEPDGSVRKPDSLFMEARKPRSEGGKVEPWEGDYPDWASAEKAAGAKGYAANAILKKVRAAALAVRDGKALWERDSVLFYHEQYNMPLLDCLTQAAQEAGGKLHVLDFGGSLGSTCAQHRRWLEKLPEWTWNVVEQPHFVGCGKRELQTEHLRFYHTVEEAMAAAPINVILLSSVLQYLEDAYALLKMLSALPASWLFIDRTPVLEGRERIMVQHVPPEIYEAAYPCRFLDRQRIEQILVEQRSISAWFPSAVDPVGFYGVAAQRNK